jgi:Lar family restriction alleviation protein
MRELRPCPFCGSRAELLHSTEGCRVECCGCGAESDIAKSDYEANRAWNSRIESRPIIHLDIPVMRDDEREELAITTKKLLDWYGILLTDKRMTLKGIIEREKPE